MAWIAASPDYGQFHATFTHLVQHKDIQFGADALILIVRIHGKQVYLAGALGMVQSIGNKTGDTAISFSDPDRGLLPVGTDRFDPLTLTLLPVRIDDGLNLRS